MLAPGLLGLGMALERNQTALEEEIRESQARIQPHLDPLEAEYKRACGKAYGNNPSDPDVAEDPENQRQAWLRGFLAEVGQGVPECAIEAQGIEWPEGRAHLLEAACNQNAHQLRLRSFVQRTAVEFGFRSSRAVCGLQKVGGSVTPTVADLDFDELLKDSTVTGWDKARWTAHYVAQDVDDVIERAKKNKGEGWNLEVLHRVKANLGRAPQDEKKAPSSVRRNQLRWWVMHEKDYACKKGKDERTGHHGSLHFVLDPRLTSSMQGADKALVGSTLLRESEPFFGSWHGPHAFSAGMKIGTLAVELAPMVAMAVQSGRLNDAARVIAQGLESYKRNGVVNGDQHADLIRNTPHGYLITLPAGAQISNLFGEIESGGITSQMVEAFKLMMESAQRASGGLYSNLGEVDSEATATAIQSAAIGYASTMGLWTSNYLDFLRQIFEKWAYWFDLSPDVRTRVQVPPEIAAQLGLETPFAEITGEVTPRNVESHRSLALAIDAFSVKAKNEMTMAQDVAVVTGAVQFLASLGPYGAAVDADKFMRAVSRSRGIKWAERLIDSRVFYALAAMQAGQQQAGQPQSTGAPKQQIQLGSTRPQSGGGGTSTSANPQATSKSSRPGYGAKKPSGQKKAVA